MSEDSWVESLDDIKVTCKKCDCLMIVESQLNDKNMILFCQLCKRHVHLEIRNEKN